ncbi:NAD-dependent epimerase/dehydratase family protein [Oleomonas cavernae]|uniref:NAD-dependent epimerase/dehydratase family protein n=1 Tax=Oleomonas cavernae TaxID=2320859 RepID=A0A418WUF9_9PROT|nr:NAD-dependent epimerase/dehydratase family protein [Oleomonas cavernae]
MPSAFVTGATGFVGINLVDELLARGWTVTCLVRAGSNTKYLDRRAVAKVTGEITDIESLRGPCRPASTPSSTSPATPTCGRATTRSRPPTMSTAPATCAPSPWKRASSASSTPRPYPSGA